MVNQTRKIIIQVDTQGQQELPKLARNLDQVSKSTRKTASVLSNFNKVLNLAFAGIGIREVARFADEVQLTQDRIAAFAKEGENAAEVFNELQAVARVTRSSIESVGTSYNRLVIATSELGLTSTQTLAVVESLQQTFRLSGSTIAEASAAAIQLSQGLASGQLRGQELRSVLESNAVFAGLLADELGTTRGELIKFAEQGTITSERVLNALANNFDSINERAAKLGITFEQALILGLDKLKVGIADFNRDFGVSSAFARGLDLAIDNFDIIFTSVSFFVGSKTLLSLAAQISAVDGALSITNNGLVAFLKTINPLTATLATAAVAIAGFRAAFRAERAEQTIAQRIEDITDRTGKLASKLQQLSSQIASDPAGQVALRSELILTQKQFDELGEELSKLLKAQAEGLKTVGEIDDPVRATLKKIEESLKGIEVKGNRTGKTIAGLNAEFGKTGDINRYNQALARIRIEELNNKFKEGKITLQEYREEMFKLKTDLGEIDQVTAGVVTGLNEVAESTGNLQRNIADGIKSTFSNLEDELVSFVTKGKFEFKKFADAVIADLTRIVIRQAIIAPIAGGLAAGFGGGAAAQGAAISRGNVLPYARGGVVGQPTYFPLAGNRTGLMGEKGPEGILPLTRTPGGDLGVKAIGGGGGNVNINIINNANADASIQRTSGPDGQEQIDVIIEQRVNRMFNEGGMDRTMQNLYGVNRRGY